MRHLTLAFATIALASPAAADMHLSEPGRYKCDAPAGHFEQQTIVPLQTEREMRVAFRLNEDRSNEKFPAMAVVYFEGPMGKSRVALGLAKNDRFQVYVAVRPPGGESEDAIFAYQLTKNWIILKLNLDKRGYLTIRANELTRKYKWGQVTNTFLHCNSGDWDLDVWPRSYVPAQVAP